MSYITKSVIVIITLNMVSLVSPQVSYEYSYNPYIKPRNITIKQGTLQGVVQELRIDPNDRTPKLVEIYRGIPYAAPPVGNFRFMPTNSEPSWFGVKFAETFGPVCPQKFPDEKEMSHLRKSHFLRLKKYLQNQSEDCLYLNIYAPYQESNTRKYPVIIYIHGESFEWNSGNPYDGSVLAAYGKVIVVTLNFRLGILGFLKLGTDATARANFGLIDQIAALVWIKGNIAAFGGKPDAVTVLGHGTGAASANLLMISEMATQQDESLFHRAILMSGSALADWALAGNPNEVTYQVSKTLNCPIHDDFADCLRKKSLNEIMAASSAITPDYRTRFGPIVDSLVLRNDPKKSMTQNDIFRKFELMYGVTEVESINILDAVALTQGMLEKERNQELRKYVRSRCETKPELCLIRTLEEYGFSEKDELFEELSGNDENKATRARDGVLDILSDALYVSPMVQTAKYHSSLNMQSYFYVFTYKTKSKEYIRNKSYYGEELPYVFGVPLGGPKFHFVDSYTEQERLFSEIIMTYICNFANTGNPNMPRKHIYHNMSPAYWVQFDVEWNEYNPSEEWYLQLDIPLQPRQHYRSKEIRYWNEIFPKLYENKTEEYEYKPTTRNPPVLFIPNRKPPQRQNPLPWVPRSPTNIQNYENFNKPYQKPRQYKENREKIFGTVVTTGMDRPDNYEKNTYGIFLEAPTAEVKQSSAISIVTIIGGLFLMANLVILLILYLKCYKNKNKTSVTKVDEATETIDGEKRQKEEETFLLNGCNIVRMMSKSSRSDDTYAAVKIGNSSKYDLSRQMSASTIDAHTKVRDWIAQEIIQKYSPRFFRRPGQSNNLKMKPEVLTTHIDIENDSTVGRSATRPVSPQEQPRRQVIQMKTSTITRPKIKPTKVSVGIDATPSGRGPSVLAQRPIELTKSLDYNNLRPENEVPLRRSITLEDFSPRVIDHDSELRKSTNSIHLNYADIQPTVIKIEHSHSKSEPVQDLDYTKMRKMKTFDPHSDINVTSKDENSSQHTPLTPEESLMTIKRRNFPKVLPDHPGKETLTNKRRSMPAHGLFLPIPESSSFSQPNTPLTNSFTKIPPVPPPRTSTLTRQSSSHPQPVYISEPTLAEDPNEEPEIVCNNLYIGPLIPKSKSARLNSQPIYESLRSLQEPRTIITANGDTPKRADPRVVVKPTLTKKSSEDKMHKNIPRVVVPDNQPHVYRPPKEECKLYVTNKTDGDDNERETRKETNNTNLRSVRPVKKSQIPTFTKGSNCSLHKESSSSDSTPSEESDTGTIVKKV